MKYALIEIVNIYDTGLTFEPIHRVLFDINPEGLMNFIGDKLGGKIEHLGTFDELKKELTILNLILDLFMKKVENQNLFL